MARPDSDVDSPEPDVSELSRSQMTFGQHLEELRSRLWRAIVASFLGLLVCFSFHESILRFVTHPYYRVMESLNQSTALKSFAPTQAFVSSVKVAFLAGLILTAPIWVYQLWAFIAAGLYRRERMRVYRLAPLSFALFLGGVVFGYTVLIPIGLEYLLTFGDPTVIESFIGLAEYLKLFTILTLLLGVAFQVPVVMVGLSVAGLAGPDAFRARRKWVVLILFILAAVFTPPDPVTQVLLAVPLCILYEAGILLAWLLQGAQRAAIDRRLLWKRVRVVAIACGVLFLLREPIRTWWLSRSVDQRMSVGEEDRRSGLLAALTDALSSGGDPGEPFVFAYRIGSASGPLRWVCFRPGRVAVADEHVQRDKVVVHQNTRESDGSRRLNFTVVPAGQVLHRLVLPAAVPLKELLPDLLESMASSSGETRRRLADILGVLTGEEAGAADDEALARFRSWFDRHSGDSLIQAL